jgi:hypothetical protein
MPSHRLATSEEKTNAMLPTAQIGSPTQIEFCLRRFPIPSNFPSGHAAGVRVEVHHQQFSNGWTVGVPIQPKYRLSNSISTWRSAPGEDKDQHCARKAYKRQRRTDKRKGQKSRGTNPEERPRENREREKTETKKKGTQNKQRKERRRRTKGKAAA